MKPTSPGHGPWRTMSLRLWPRLPTGAGLGPAKQKSSKHPNPRSVCFRWMLSCFDMTWFLADLNSKPGPESFE